VTFIIESNMETVTAYHGTGELESILNDGAVYCLGLVMHGHDEFEERIHNEDIEKYEKLTAELAEAIRKKREKQKRQKRAFRYEWEFQQANGLEEALADVAILFHYSGYGSMYSELIRLTHVFLSSYEGAKMYAKNNFKTILEFEIPEELVRPTPSSGNILVRKKVDLQYLRRVYVEASNVEKARGLLNNYGVRDVKVDVIK